MNKVSTILTLSSIFLLATGCFTGIESTPKITAENVKRENVVVTAEDKFLSDISAEPFKDWTPGKKFIVTDDKIALIFGASAAQNIPAAGSAVTYKGFKESTDLTGDTATDLIFSSADGSEYLYRINNTPTELMQRDKINIPFTIEQCIIDATSQKLKNSNLYIRTSVWYDSDDRLTYGRRFVPVTITDVLPGNSVYPIKLVFYDASGDSSRLYRLFLSVGDSDNSARDFASLFSFDNPRLKYPDISDANWQNIINSRVAIDMTRDECRLALGTPNDVVRRPGYDKVQEIWSYDDGVYLIFEDGLLRNFRK